MRLLPLLLLSCLAVSVHALTEGDACVNGSVCDGALVCISNRCVANIDSEANGLGNKCGPDDCCNAGLVCDSTLSLCSPAIGNTIWVCGGGGATATADSPSAPDTPDMGGNSNNGEADNNSDGTPTDIPVGQPPRTGLAQGATCGNADTCGAGLACLANRCASTGGSTANLNGLGNVCSDTNCCPSGLVCNQLSQRCTPNVVQLASLTCTSGFVGGAGSGVAYQAATGIDVNNPGNNGGDTNVPSSIPVGQPPRTNLAQGSTCGNADSCGAGLACLGNVCSSAGDSAASVHGLGNVCSASNCCPSGLACNQLTQRCTPNVVQLGAIACTSGFVGGPGSGVQYTGSQPIDINNPANVNAAATLSMPTALLTLLAAMALLVLRW